MPRQGLFLPDQNDEAFFGLADGRIIGAVALSGLGLEICLGPDQVFPPSGEYATTRGHRPEVVELSQATTSSSPGRFSSRCNQAGALRAGSGLGLGLSQVKPLSRLRVS